MGGHARREAPGEEVVWIGGGGGGDRGGERSLWMRAIASARRRRSLAFTALIWTASTYSKTSDSLLASFSASSAASSSSGTAVCSARCPVETETRKVRGYRKTSPANEMITIRAMKKPRAVSSIAAADAMRRRAPAAKLSPCGPLHNLNNQGNCTLSTRCPVRRFSPSSAAAQPALRGAARWWHDAANRAP